ncbi:DUF4232 domain-containing protein, partial [Kitasatospora sp. LaBMicrA B282]|uniref:DUF4232 domain-containing protein n=1 Tax=Kitasatospora sp. LaBMicrA B282 TaxID=3420949 RepID=UPI003D10F606
AAPGQPAGSAPAGSAQPSGSPSVKPGRSTDTKGSPAAVDRCHTDDVMVTVQLQPALANSAMVMVTNMSSRACTIDGYLGYGGRLADNSQLSLSTNRVAYPGAPVASTLKPHTSAFAGLKWAACDKADPSCHVLAGVTVTPPDETTQTDAHVLDLNGKPVQQLLVSAAGFTVGSLQPSNEGVTFTS